MIASSSEKPAEPDAIGNQVFDDLVAEGVAEDGATWVAFHVFALLYAGRWSPELLVASIPDHAGRPWFYVLPALPPGAEPLFRLDMTEHRRQARQAVIEAKSSPARAMCGPRPVVSKRTLGMPAGRRATSKGPRPAPPHP